MKKTFRIVIAALFVVVLTLATILVFLTVDEYKPEGIQTLEIEGESIEAVGLDCDYSIMTWNIGYGALGDNADFFMDGGKMVYTADRERVDTNLTNICDEITALEPDFLFVQEMDRSSARSYFVDEMSYIKSGADTPVTQRVSTFANNYKVAYVPLPVPPIGKVDTGIGTFSRYIVDSSERVALPCPFTWPLSTINLKRCLQVSRAPVVGSDKELVLINLHLEAYDDGEGKKEQTAMLKELLQSEYNKGNYVIAGGDFNQTFSTADMSGIPQLDVEWHAGVIDQEDFGEDLIFYTDSSVPTCRSLDRPLADAQDKSPESFQYYVIDGFIVSSNVEVTDCHTEDLGFINSDHNPIVLDFLLK